MDRSSEQYFLHAAITVNLFKEAMALATRLGRRFRDVLTELELGFSFATEEPDLSAMSISCCVITMVPESLAREHSIMPLGRDDDGTLIVAVHDSIGIEALDHLRLAIDRDIKLVVTAKDNITAAIDHHYVDLDFVDVIFCY